MVGLIEQYHRETSYSRYEMGRGGLDFGNQPEVFKTYPGLPTVPLPQVMTLPEEQLSSLVRQALPTEPDLEIDVNSLAQILILTHSLTAKARYGATEFYYRSVASAGALYPFELYVAAHNVPGLADGVYHHSVALHSLTLLRAGNPMPLLSRSLVTGKAEHPALAFILTSIFFRSSWKYRERGYRYAFLDTGHMVENLFLSLCAIRLPFRLLYDFDDSKLNDMVGVDQHREVCLAVACVWGKTSADEDTGTELKSAPTNLPSASRVSVRERDYPLITDVHASTCTALFAQDKPVRMLEHLGLQFGPAEKVPVTEQWPEVMKYSDTVFKRRSQRNFVRSPLPRSVLAALLESLIAIETEQPCTDSIAANSISMGLVASNVEDLEPGFYLLDTNSHTIRPGPTGSFTDQIAHVCLDQGWLSNCAAHFVFLCNLELLDHAWGPRGYRHAMLTAGRLGQRLYLTATSMRLGCCGIGAFYDREAADFLGLNDRSALLYLVATGPLKKWSNLER